jgi:hypothetical protein
VVHYTISVVMELHIGVMRIFPLFGRLVDGSVYEWVLGYLAVLIGGREGSVVAGINKGMHESIRRRALKKAAKSK